MPTHSCLRMLLAHHDEGVTDATHTAHHAPPAALEATDPRTEVSGAGASQCRGYRHWVREPLVAVPPDRAEQPVREFRSFTHALIDLADWLTACDVDTVAMESTGVWVANS